MRPLVLSVFLLLGSPAVSIAQQAKAITNSIGMKLELIHAGSFAMGSSNDEVGRQKNETLHEVTIRKSFYLGVFEVTQGQYEKVMRKNPSRFRGSQLPVEYVSWDDAVSFCAKLSEIPEEKAAGRLYRLPTEAEWEYACRASSTTSYCFGDNAELLREYAWFGEGIGGKTHPVGVKKANRWGLHDMHGNVWEWCQDMFAAYPSDEAIDPRGPKEGSDRVNRGGAWVLDAAACRSAHRYANNSTSRGFEFGGFRAAMSLPTALTEPE